jgi:acetyltransferase-like isoleucine patch superfamily enzyme
MRTSFYSPLELAGLGLHSYGDDVRISRNASIYRPENISLASHVRVDDFCLLSGGAGIRIGNYVHISAYAAVYGGGGVIMHDYSGLSPRSTIFSENDDYSGESMVHPWFPPEFKPGYVRGLVVLHKFVQVGAASTLLPGIVLGEGVAIGAHSLVKTSCAPWRIYAGVPARFIKERSRSIELLERRYLETRGGEML